ncbi:hypothetical protein, partial [Trichloromonas sp.]|uniref:hypothetical protein n=1 Tax=Trichloromonas sp. TaxID=3069249 RepID=UPI003D8147C0
MLLVCCLLAGCAETLLTGAAPEPPPGDKLRVYLKVITSGHLKEDWRGTEQRAEATARPLLAKVFDGTGFCALINGTDLDKVMPSPSPGWWW